MPPASFPRDQVSHCHGAIERVGVIAPAKSPFSRSLNVLGFNNSVANFATASRFFPFHARHSQRTSIHVANLWSSDQPGNGLALLCLGTTRRNQSEEHRVLALAEIDRDIAWNRSRTGTPDEVNEPIRDIPDLENLLKLGEGALIGEEWLTDAEIMRFNNELHRAGKLG